MWKDLDPSKKEVVKKKVRELEKAMVKTPPSNPFDPNYRRISYIRYADDLLIGIIGSKNDAKKIKSDISKFAKDKLKLEMSEQKTLITHSKKKARFLGYDITVVRNNTPKRNSKGILSRVYNNAIKLYVPKDVWVRKLIDYKALKIFYDKNAKKEKWHPISRKHLKNNQSENILKQYNYEIRGLYNYYQIANNAATLHKFNYIMYYSMLRTLADKYRKSVKKIRSSFDVNGHFGIKYQTNIGEKVMMYYDGGFRRKKFSDSNPKNVDIKTEYTYPFGRYSPAHRMRKRICELCEAPNVTITMYQVRRLTEILPDTPWHTHMLKNNRKTLSVCEHCYNIIQAS